VAVAVDAAVPETGFDACRRYFQVKTAYSNSVHTAIIVIMRLMFVRFLTSTSVEVMVKLV